MNLINWLGVGTVAATKQTNTGEIMVHLAGQAPTADGRVVAHVEQKQETSLNANGEQETSTTMVSNVVPATWQSMGEPNRVTAPDVREGSKVSIYQVSGQNKYYWTTHGFSADTHRLETIIWGFSANPALDENTPFNIDNFFTAKVDTREGFFSLRTSQSNGEKSGLEVKVDGKNGQVNIRGSEDSILSFDDFAHKLTYRNQEGAIIGVDKKNMAFYAPDSLTIASVENINVKTKNLNVQCKNITVQAELAKVAIPRTIWEGDIEQKGDYTQEGDYKLTGDIDQTGDMEQEGNLTSSGTIHADIDVTSLTSLNFHITTGVKGGPDMSGPPLPTGG